MSYVSITLAGFLWLNCSIVGHSIETLGWLLSQLQRSNPGFQHSKPVRRGRRPQRNLAAMGPLWRNCLGSWPMKFQLASLKRVHPFVIFLGVSRDNNYHRV